MYMVTLIQKQNMLLKRIDNIEGALPPKVNTDEGEVEWFDEENIITIK